MSSARSESLHERWVLLQSMLLAIPLSIPNNPDSLTQYLLVCGEWSLEDIRILIPEIMEARK